MALLRRASAYSKKYAVPYTRTSKKKQRAYIKAVPASKIVKYWMGNMNAFESGKYAQILTMVTDENIQIRQNALEACRQYINKQLEEQLSGQYFFRVVPFAHHIQRENKMLTAAGADRMSTGMQLSFGKNIAKAAMLRTGDRIFIIATTNQKSTSIARKILNQVKSKLPCKTRLLFELKTN